MRIILFAIFTLLFAFPAYAGADQDKVDELTAKLKSENAGRAADAAEDLMKLGESAKSAVPALIEALDDQRPTEVFPVFVPVSPKKVASYASEALIAIGNAAVPDLVVALKTKQESKKQRRIVDILWRIGPPAKDALPQLKLLYENEADDDLRFSALGAYTTISPSNPECVTLLTKALSDKSPHVCGLAARELGGMGKIASESVPALTRTLADLRYRGTYIAPDAAGVRAVRFDAAEALGKIGPPASQSSIRLRELMTEDEDPEVRVSAALALFRIDLGNDDAMKALITELESDEERLSAPIVAAESLAKLGPKAEPAFDSLTKALNHEHEDLRRHAARAIGGIGGKRAVTVLLPLLKDADPLVRVEAAETLGSLGDLAAPAVPGLIELLKDKSGFWSHDVIIAAANALGEIGPAASAAVPELQRLNNRRVSPGIQKAASEAIKQIEGENN